MSRHHRATLALPLLLVASAGAFAQSPAIRIEHARARATPGAAKTGVVYLTIVDHGAPDRLISASTPVAATADLHETITDGSVMKMRAVEGGLPVSAGDATTLTPGGTHLMLTGLRQPLRMGQSFPLTLTFERSGPVQTTVSVAGMGAEGPMPMSGMNHETPPAASKP